MKSWVLIPVVVLALIVMRFALWSVSICYPDEDFTVKDDRTNG